MPDAAMQDLDRTLDDILAPLREQGERIEAELAQLDARRAELKAALSKVNRVLGANKPRVKPGPKTRPPRAARNLISEEKVNEVADYLNANVNGEFTSPHLAELHDFKLTTQGLNRALTKLHERGMLRLVRQGGVPGLGNRVKVWEVVRSGK